MLDDNLQEMEIEDPREGDDEIGGPIRYMITSYGADIPVDGLVRRLDREDIFVPDFQRQFVWTLSQASRFVESLLLGLPVPGVFLFKEPDQKLMVVDGQQRLLTLQSFFKGVFGDRQFKLIGVSDEFHQKTYETLALEDQRRLDDSILHATIFQQNEPSEDRSSVYEVFERLNTGGTALSPQEIRACVSRGKMNQLLTELAENHHWRELYRAKQSRKKDEEIILRFFSLYFQLDEYKPPLRRFLDDFMEKYKDLDQHQQDTFHQIFGKTVETVATILSPKALRPERAFNVAVADAVLVGLAHRLDKGPISDHDALRAAHDRLSKKLRDEGHHKGGATDKDRMNTRIQYACEEYGLIP